MSNTKEKQLSPAGKYLKALLIEIAKGLEMQHLEALKIEVSEMQVSTTLIVEAHEDDHGKLVGTGGVMINALKPFFELAGERLGVRVRFTLNNPPRQSTVPKPKFKPDPEWTHEKIRPLVDTLCAAVLSKPYKLTPEDNGETTTYEVIPSHHDPMLKNAAVIETSIAPILHAIGKSKGRNEVYFDLAKACVL